MLKRFFSRKSSSINEPLLPHSASYTTSTDANVNQSQMEPQDNNKLIQYKKHINNVEVGNSDFFKNLPFYRSSTIPTTLGRHEININKELNTDYYKLEDLLERFAVLDITVETNKWIVALICVPGEVKRNFGFKSQKKPNCVGQIIFKNIDKNYIAFMLKLNNTDFNDRILIYDLVDKKVFFYKYSTQDVYTIHIQGLSIQTGYETLYVVDPNQIEKKTTKVEWIKNQDITALELIAIDALIIYILFANRKEKINPENIEQNESDLKEQLIRINRVETIGEVVDVGGAVSKHNYRVRKDAVGNRKTKRHKYKNVRKMKSRMHNRKRNSKVSRKLSNK